MLYSFATLTILLQLVVYLGVTLPLLLVEVLHELLDVRDAVPARVVVRRGHYCLIGVIWCTHCGGCRIANGLMLDEGW